MSEQKIIAVVGATGVVGREMLNILHERKFPVSEIVALASRRSVGKDAHFGNQKIKVLGRGEITKTLAVKAHKFSGAAAQKIQAAGGSAETL